MNAEQHADHARADLLKTAFGAAPRRRRGGRKPTFTTDHNGAPIVLVPLANAERYAVVDRADFEALKAAGWSENWTLNTSGRGRAYVSVADPNTIGQLARPARLIMGSPHGRHVRYRDGDTTNLRGGNLYLVNGPAAGLTPKEPNRKAA